MFSRSTIDQCHTICTTLWIIWYERNKTLHGRKVNTGKGIIEIIQRYINELNVLEARNLTKQGTVAEWIPPKTHIIKINFDAVYD